VVGPHGPPEPLDAVFRREPAARHAGALPDAENPPKISEFGRAARADALERFEPGEGEYAEPSLAVLKGERVDEEAPGETDAGRELDLVSASSRR